MKNYNSKITALEAQLQELQISSSSGICRTEKAIQLVSKTLISLREYVLQNGFDSRQDEIEFFKNVKPKVFSKLIFFKDLLDIEVKRSFSSEIQLMNYTKDKIERFQLLFQDNLEFIHYYQNESTYLDDLYYTRKQASSPVIGLNYLYFTDLEFSTSHDQLVTSILAHELLSEHLEKESNSNQESWSSNLYWSESKVALVELIYALHYSGSISNGKSDIKQLCGIFEKMFNIELGEIYRIFVSIRQRKSDVTRFIDKLTLDLSAHIDDLEK